MTVTIHELWPNVFLNPLFVYSGFDREQIQVEALMDAMDAIDLYVEYPNQKPTASKIELGFGKISKLLEVDFSFRALEQLFQNQAPDEFVRDGYRRSGVLANQDGTPKWIKMGEHEYAT